MSTTSRFRIQKHTLPTSHIREYPRATANDQEEVLHLAIKQYTPLDQVKADEGDVTLIGAHANGFPKELYEPLWDDLYDRLKSKNIRIRSIWIADVAQQGDSGVLNEDQLGDDPSWMDHPRDLFLMINHFRKHMKRPLVGLGHSMGGNNLVNLSLIHPRLFTSLILVDPVIERLNSYKDNRGIAQLSLVRRDRWPSRKEAKEKFSKSKFYQTWDPRVFAKWVEHGLRELPTALYPDVNISKGTLPAVSADPSGASIQPEKETEREVTLKTTKYQEVMTFKRANFETAEFPTPSTKPNLITHPDVDPATHPNSPFYRPEPLATFHKLPYVRPSVFYVFGDLSDLSTPLAIADKMANTGIGVGGSGGVKQGRVGQHTFKGIGHLIPMEVVSQTADVVAEWLKPELDRWRTLEDAQVREWDKVPKAERKILRQEYVERMKVSPGKQDGKKHTDSKL